MKQIILLFSIAFMLVSCGTSMSTSSGGELYQEHSAQEFISPSDTLIVQSLFGDRSSSITEENIQRVLDGSYRLPAGIRLAVIRLESGSQRYKWNDENYIKTNQSYLDSFEAKLKSSPHIKSVSTIPGILLGRSPSITSIRETAVRMQCDMVLVYSITDDLYSKYKFFSATDIKAFATTQMVLMDIRTGLIPFSTIVTKDYFSKKNKEDLDQSQTRDRIINEAALASIGAAGQQIVSYLGSQ